MRLGWTVTIINLLQGEIELKKKTDIKKCLFYLDKAVELNDYDETALVARSREEIHQKIVKLNLFN